MKITSASLQFLRKSKKGCRNLSNTIVNMSSGRIPCKSEELDLGITLNGGQSFRWVSMDNGHKYRGSFAGHVWTLSQIEDNIFYRLHSKSIKEDNLCVETLKKYFNLDVPLMDNIKEWSARDPHFEKSCSSASGVRILNQDILENLFAFICSSNNNIKRISSLVEKMCTLFGRKICVVDKKQYYDFPTIDALNKPNVVDLLRKEGFGYRALYIAETAKKLKQLGGRQWLQNLHKDNGTNYDEARVKLMELSGVGPKVADCICLMSLGHLEAIPVDTHIFQVAQSIYMPHLKTRKTVTPQIHEEVSKYLRELWGPLSGWAQTIVFCAKIGSHGDSPSKKLAIDLRNEEEFLPKKKQRKR